MTTTKTRTRILPPSVPSGRRVASSTTTGWASYLRCQLNLFTFFEENLYFMKPSIGAELQINGLLTHRKITGPCF